jgi:hypothetical protein
VSKQRQQQQQTTQAYQDGASPKQQVHDNRSSSEHLNTKAISKRQQQQQKAQTYQERAS